MASLVVVFAADPVTAIKGFAQTRRTAVANICRAIAYLRLRSGGFGLKPVEL